MKNYETYELEDFICDDVFISWCLHPDDKSEQFWNQFMNDFPERKSILLSAKEFVKDLYAIETEEQKENFDKVIWNEIEVNINKPKKWTLKPILKWVAAAAAIVVLGIASFLILEQLDQQSLIETQKELWKNHVNNTGLTKKIILPDGSTVDLEPFSTLKYPEAFTKEQRSVFLTGEAFFDIQRDTTKPFLVYANETITKVLGTSFKIIAFEGQKTVEVEVKTGKVAVYAKVDSKENKQKRLVIQADEKIYIPLPNKKLEVTPNQKVVFNRSEKQLAKTLSTLPTVIKSLKELPQLDFQNEPITKVFSSLEEIYGIRIQYDNEALKNCLINTKLDDEPLFEKLGILCAALNLEFIEKDAIIIISGEGC